MLSSSEKMPRRSGRKVAVKKEHVGNATITNKREVRRGAALPSKQEIQDEFVQQSIKPEQKKEVVRDSLVEDFANQMICSQQTNNHLPVKVLKEEPDTYEQVTEQDSAQPTTNTTSNSSDVDFGDGEVTFADQLNLEEARAKAEADKLQNTSETQDNLKQNSHNMRQLDVLLDRISMYTQFIKEQLPEKGKEELDEGEDDSGNQENIPLSTDFVNVDEGADDKSKKRKRESFSTEKPNKLRRMSVGSTFVPEDLPLFKGNLRDYQVVGVHWLVSLYQNGMNGILADQMGLGKTIQTIAFFSYLRQMEVFGPFMVVAPLSTIINWKMEFDRFLPGQPTIIYHGDKQEREEIRGKYIVGRNQKNVGPDFPLFITSFEMIRMDRKYFQGLFFKYVVVDEGHKVKNHNSQLSQELRQLNIENRLILTGTPLQNNVTELWSLLNFVMPDAFRSLSQFTAIFDFSAIGTNNEDIVQQERRNQIVSKLHKILDPFILRRVKKVAAPDLPPKQDIVLYAPMTKVQMEMTDDILKNRLQKKLQEEYNTKNRMNRTLKFQVMQLRKVANHPDLIIGDYCCCRTYPPVHVLLEQSGKLQLLERLLDKLLAKGHKVLIFSQFVIMLDVLHYYFEERGMRVGRLDGQMKFEERMENIKQFCSDGDMKVFMLSTRAGGLGINLTAADTVIVFDSDWNPQADLQAQDRCHRIGQTKPVLVFRLATSNSAEIRMLERASQKLTLERLLIKNGKRDQVFTESDGSGRLTEEQLLELLKSDVELCKNSQQKPISDEMLDRLLVRDYLNQKELPFERIGAGYEVLQEKNDVSQLG